MPTMPRKSAAASFFPTINGPSERLRPTAELTEIEKQIFCDIVAASKPNAFQPSDMPLLINYCQAIAAAREANEHLRSEGRVVDGKPSAWLAVLAMAQKGMLAFAHRLRLSPQGRSPSVSGKPTKPPAAMSYYDRMLAEQEVET
jgi:phage terminase small subunit